MVQKIRVSVESRSSPDFLIVARTDAESATFLENRSDERDQPFILGATNVSVPSYKAAFIAIHKKLAELGVDDTRGHLLFEISERAYEHANAWLKEQGLFTQIEETAKQLKGASVAKS